MSIQFSIFLGLLTYRNGVGEARFDEGLTDALAHVGLLTGHGERFVLAPDVDGACLWAYLYPHDVSSLEGKGGVSPPFLTRRRTCRTSACGWRGYAGRSS